jgi:hypothetical protein
MNIAFKPILQNCVPVYSHLGSPGWLAQFCLGLTKRYFFFACKSLHGRNHSLCTLQTANNKDLDCKSSTFGFTFVFWLPESDSRLVDAVQGQCGHL